MQRSAAEQISSHDRFLDFSCLETVSSPQIDVSEAISLRGPGPYGPSGPRMRPLCARFYAVVIEDFFIRRKMMGTLYMPLQIVCMLVYMHLKRFVFLYFLFIVGAKHFSNVGI